MDTAHDGVVDMADAIRGEEQDTAIVFHRPQKCCAESARAQIRPVSNLRARHKTTPLQITSAPRLEVNVGFVD